MRLRAEMSVGELVPTLSPADQGSARHTCGLPHAGSINAGHHVLRPRQNSIPVSTRGKESMQIAEVVRTLGLCSVVGLAGFAVGCGSDGGQDGSGETKGAAIKEEQKNARKEARQARENENKPQRARAK
jgi:hypothetical protein